MAKFWFNDGKLVVDGDGKWIDCGTCPCGTDEICSDVYSNSYTHSGPSEFNDFDNDTIIEPAFAEWSKVIYELTFDTVATGSWSFGIRLRVITNLTDTIELDSEGTMSDSSGTTVDAAMLMTPGNPATEFNEEDIAYFTDGDTVKVELERVDNTNTTSTNWIGRMYRNGTQVNTVESTGATGFLESLACRIEGRFSTTGDTGTTFSDISFTIE